MSQPHQASRFNYDGNEFPIPAGWAEINSAEDWYYKLEQIKEHVMNVHEEDLEPMVDDDGDELDQEVVLLIQKYGFLSGQHWELFNGWSAAYWSARTGEDAANMMIRLSSIGRERIMAEKANAMRGAGGAMEPVEAVSLEQWAHIQAALAQSADIDTLLSQAGIDRPRWDRVSAEWMARMQTDTTATIATAYGNAFAGAGQGQFGQQAAHAAAVGVAGDLGDEPISFEQFCEIEQAMSAASDRGEDVVALLERFGLKPADWGNVGAYWSKKIMQESQKYHQLHSEYSEKYRAKYAG